MKYGSLQEAREAYAVKSAALDTIFREAATTVDGQDRYDFMRSTDLSGTMDERVDKVREYNKELNDLNDEVRRYQDLEDGRALAARGVRDSNEPRPFTPFAGGPGAAPRKTFGQLFFESPIYNQYHAQRQWPQFSLPDLTIMDALYYEGAGWAPEVMRIPRVELMPQATPDVLDSIPQLGTSQIAIAYMEETTFTNTAAETAEATAVAAADLIPEAALAMTARQIPVQWIPVFIPVTQQQMEDVDGIQAYLSSRLSLMIRLRMNSQVLQGNGVAPNLMGTANVVGHLTQAKGADPIPDAIYKAMNQIRTTGRAEPSVVFVHPNDWQDVRLLRTADGIYLWGSPSDSGPDRIWGVPVVQTTACVQDTAIVGDYRNYAALYTKRGIDVAVSDQHAFYFTRGTLAVRADTRVAMVHYRPSAFCTVTGI